MKVSYPHLIAAFLVAMVALWGGSFLIDACSDTYHFAVLMTGMILGVVAWGLLMLGVKDILP